MTEIFILLVLFQVKHFLADYPLQTSYHLRKLLPGWDFVLPLASHAGVHSLFTLAIVFFVNPVLWWLSVVDFVIHFVMDRIKAGPKYLGRYKSLSGGEFMANVKIVQDKYASGLMKEDALKKIKGNRWFWVSLGADQKVHHLTHYFIIWMLVS